jgi:hypothetical protein
VQALTHTQRWCWLLGIAALLWACGRPAGGSAPDIAVDVVLTPRQPVVGQATIVITLNDAADHPVQGAEVALEGYMTHPGMAPIDAQAREVAAGRYQAPLWFTMQGDWVLVIHARLPDGRMLERQIDVRDVKLR